MDRDELRALVELNLDALQPKKPERVHTVYQGYWNREGTRLVSTRIVMNDRGDMDQRQIHAISRWY